MTTLQSAPAGMADPRRDKIRRRVIWIAAAVLGVLIVVLLIRLFSGTKKPPPAPPVTTITAATARQGSIGVYLDAIGTVTPVYTAQIAAQVNGLVTAVHFKEGQMVAKGDPLIDIDARPYVATLMQAQGALQRDENLLAQAKMDLERYRAAWARNAIAKQILDDQEKLVLQDEGVVKSDQGAVQYDQVQVEFCHIVSPISGRVGLRLVDPGNYVTSSGGTIMAVVTQLKPITVIFTIPEDDVGKVEARVHSGAKLSVDAFDRTAQTKIESGELLTLNNQIDTTTGTVKARAVFDNKPGGLFPNQFVNTRLLVNTLQGVTLIPSSAVQQNGTASYVYVIQDCVAHNRAVKPGVTDGGVTQVDGLNPGEVVANSSFDKLKDNAPIVIAAKPAAAGTQPASAAAGAAAAPAGTTTTTTTGTTTTITTSTLRVPASTPPPPASSAPAPAANCAAPAAASSTTDGKTK